MAAAGSASKCYRESSKGRYNERAQSGEAAGGEARNPIGMGNYTAEQGRQVDYFNFKCSL